MINSWDVVDSIRDAVEDYGQACWQDGYDEAKDEFESSFDSNDDAILKYQGYVKVEHMYQGRSVYTWVEGPDFKGERFSW